jgi:hypothetical protein
MELSEIHDHARWLMEAHGPKTIAEKRGDTEQAKSWRDIEQALLLRRGPSVS